MLVRTRGPRPFSDNWGRMFVYYLLNYLFIADLARAHLPVKQPAFKSSSMTIRSEENDTVFLPCVVEDLGESSIRWWKGEILLSDSSSPMVAILPKFTVLRDGLTIDSLQPEDAGEYTCELVRPKPWSSLRQFHQVEVLYPPKIFPVPPDGHVEARLGDKVRLGCSALGVPHPVITWKKLGVSVEFGESNERLEFIAANRLMSGVYQCEANNGIGNPVHTNIALKILHKPEITVDKTWVHSGPGIKTALTCHIVAEPEAQVEWLFDGERLAISGPRITYQVRGGDHVLQFKSVTASDFGNYTCTARNELGSSAAFVELSGVANPAVIKKAEGISATDFSLVWEVDSYSPVFEYKVHFRKEQDPRWVSFIIPADSFPSGPLHSKSYTFSGLDKFGVYEAKIYSRNRFGWSDSSEVVTFGFSKPKYVEGTESSNEVVGASMSGARPLVGNVLVVAVVLFKFSPSTYDTS